MNRIILSGNITKDIVVKKTTTGIWVANANIAVKRSNGNGVEYFPLIFWRVQAENAGKYLKCGSKINVIGELHNRHYKDKAGHDRQATEISVLEVEFLPKSEIENFGTNDHDTANEDTVGNNAFQELMSIEEGDLPY